MPGVPLVGLFETAFYQWVPEAAVRYAVPEAWHALGVGLNGAALARSGVPADTAVHGVQHYEDGRLNGVFAESDAMQLAARYQLVTPVSGAVVLETQAQYQQAGLQPVPPESVPTVPEPSATVLLPPAVVRRPLAVPVSVASAAASERSSMRETRGAPPVPPPCSVS